MFPVPLQAVATKMGTTAFNSTNTLMSQAVFVLCCGFALCNKKKLREFSVFKRFLLWLGVDHFPEFDLYVVVHNISFNSPNSAKKTEGTHIVRCTAGAQQVSTEPCDNGTFEQPLILFVEQGTQFVNVEMLDSNHKVLAYLKFNIMTDILKRKDRIQEKSFDMKKNAKHILDPRVRLTAFKDDSDENDLLLHHDRESMEMLPSLEDTPQTLASKCSGPLQIVGRFGEERVHIAVKGPPETDKYFVGIWDDQHSYQKGKDARAYIPLLRILGIHPHEDHSDQFYFQFLDTDKTQQEFMFRVIGRDRDSWVVNLVELIIQVREEREEASASPRSPR